MSDDLQQPPSPQEPEYLPPVPVQPEPPKPEPSSSGGSWIVGIVLVILGIVFLARNYLSFNILDNWWALFILIPAVGSFVNAWNVYQKSGKRITPAVRGPLVGGLILTLVAGAFLFDLNWGLIWPVILIIVGIGALVAASGKS